MSNQLLTRLQDEQRDRQAFVSNILEAAESEERALSDAELANIDAAKDRMEQLRAQIEPVLEWQERANAAQSLDRQIVMADKASTQTRAMDPDPLSGSTLGEAFIRSPEYRSAQSGVMRERFTAPTTLGELRAPQLLTTTSTPVGAVMMPNPQKIMQAPGLTAFRLYDAVSHVPISTGNAVDVVTYGTKEGARTVTKVTEGSEKPQLEVTASQQTITLAVYAGWLQLTRQLISEPGVRGYIDGEIVRGIMTAIETEISTVLAAAITGGSIPAVTGGSGQPIEEVIRMAVATVEWNGWTPTAVLLNPSDAAGIDIAAAKLGGSAAFGANVNPWGLQVIPSPLIKAGEAVVGDIGMGITIYERTGIDLYATDSDIIGSGSTTKSAFRSNVITLLGEQRCGVAVTRPQALAVTKLTP